MSNNMLCVPTQPHFDAVSDASTDGDLEYQDFSIYNATPKHKNINSPMKSNEKVKTSLCRKFCEKGYCPYGNKCQFAHGVAELRCVTDEHKYKTKKCISYSKNGYCQYGPRCNFLHQTSTQAINGN